ncbi:unnamed protein product, partial [Prorocentrum cordatum]
MVQDAAVPARAMNLLVSAFNVQGGLGSRRGEGAHEGRIRDLVVALHSRGVVLAVLSEPRLAPGSLWPRWAGYAYHGERSALPDTVALLVLDEIGSRVEVLEGVGDARAVWAAVSMGGSARTGVLLLGVYGPPPNYGVGARRTFWKTRVDEWRQLRARPCFLGWSFLLAGDFNFHFSALGGINGRLEESLDRDVWQWLHDACHFGSVVRNPVGCPTHASGSIIDVVASSPELVTEVKVVAPADAGLRSDHRRLDVSVAGVVDCTGESAVGFARWERGADWGEALLLVPLALRFLVGWAGTAMRSAVVRRWVVEGRCRGTRQGLLDRVVWWRAVVYTLAGHFAGMSVAHGPRGQPRGVGAAGADRDDDDEGVGPGELRAAWAAAAAGDADPPARKAATRALDRYLELAAASPGEAEAFLSRALEPRLPVQLALRCPVSGELLGLADALEVITEDVLSRGAQAGSGDAAFNRAVADEEARADPEARKRAVKHWKRTVVLPAVLAYEQAWFVLQLGAVGTSGLLPYRELIPIRGPLSAGVRWAPWGRTMWRFYQAWALARASGRMPVEVWLAEGVAAVPLACPLCAAPAPEGCTLVECLGHLLSACPAVAPLRVACSTSDVARWALGDVEDTAALAPRVRLVGLASRAWVLG